LEAGIFKPQMPKTISQYSVFIGSPGGLAKERARFRASLDRFSLHHARDKGVLFHPVGWEDTIGGAGRPQALINDDLQLCDYAVFVLHDRWGSPTGDGHTSGTEEEWALAEELYRANKIRNIALFFKQVDTGRIADPGDQLKRVLAFQQRIEQEKRYLFKQYRTLDEFVDALDGHLAQWLRDHEKAKTEPSLSDQAPAVAAVASNLQSPTFDYWLAEAKKSLNDDNAGALFCASKAINAAKSDIEWAEAKNYWAIAQSYLGKVDETLSAFSMIAERFATSLDADRRFWCAQALVNKAITLGKLGRGEDKISGYDEVISQFGESTELPLRELVARALVNKGAGLGALDRSEDEISVYDEVLARFGASTELPLRAQVARALVNKGCRLEMLGRTEDAISLYDEVIARFDASEEPLAREHVMRAMELRSALVESPKLTRKP